MVTFIVGVLMFVVGMILGWYLTLRGGYFTFHLGDSREQSMSFMQWRSNHLARFMPRKKDE